MSVEDVRLAGADAVLAVSHPEYKAKIERIVLINVVAFDWNCPQHITRRYTESEYAEKTV